MIQEFQNKFPTFSLMYQSAWCQEMSCDAAYGINVELYE
jgi:hypothetical protein